MLATFVIGLREGLEAALIVSIIAAFLRKNGKSLGAMWVGVALAVMLSVAVGVSLELVERALPQAAQEGMESVIGAIAIFFVTGMIVWMNAHARNMRKELEAQATAALSHARAYALAGMAFLAVLREGFETSVFLLATFSAAQSATLAATGAVIGVFIAVAIGWGIYVGGVRVNLSRFFLVTGAFLILVAAGLAVTALRTAHEAGWLNAGQQTTVNLSWLVAPGTVQSALITGVLGVPADPRRIEVIGWLAYLVPVALFVYWPASHRPSPRGVVRLQVGATVALAVIAALLATVVPMPHPQGPAQATLVSGTDASPAPIGIARLRTTADGSPAALEVSLGAGGDISRPLSESSARQEDHDGVEASAWSLDGTSTPDNAPATVTLNRVIRLAGGRIPVGLNPQQHPGPFTAQWLTHRSTKVWTAEGILLDATERAISILTLSGSGLHTPRTMIIRDEANARSGNWQISPDYRERVIAELETVAAARGERRFWAVHLPVALWTAAFIVGAMACRSLRRLRRSRGVSPTRTILYGGSHADESPQGATHVTD